jgi:hypothetical protein
MKTKEEKQRIAEEGRKAMAEYLQNERDALHRAKTLRELRLAQSDNKTGHS